MTVDDDAPTLLNPRALADGTGAIPAELSRYELMDKLGSGGMAAVYRARDTLSGRMVALKLIDNGDDDKSRQARFEREVRAAGKLVHPNVCRVLSFGRAPARLFMTMELVEGVTLHRMTRARGTLPVPVALEVLRQLLSALACAHGAGVVHRDLKPANVMVTPEGTVKLLDFGIAKSQEDATVTASGLLVGTPAFMAPEQVLGTSTGPKSDLFSAGVTFLVMLTGRIRFHGRDPATVMVKVSSDPVPSLLEECPHAGPAVDRFLQKLCAQEPAGRYDDANAALSALAQLEELPADDDGPSLLARYLVEPDSVALGLAHVCAEREVTRAERLAAKGALPAAALCLHRAQLLEPRDATKRRLAEVCAAGALTFDLVDDPKIADAMKSFGKTPNAAGVLKRLADLYRAKGNVLLSAAFLTRYVRVKPSDTAASTQLRLLLEGQASGPATGERLRTREIVAGRRTAEVQAQPARSLPPLARPVTSSAPRTQEALAPTVMVASAGGHRPIFNVHPLVLVVAAVVVAGIAMAFFGRFLRATVDDAQLAVPEKEQR